QALGDPHIKTLDGLEYALNYLEEKILLYIVEQKFMVQARTKQVVNSKGDKTNATIFVAFAAKVGNYSSFQVELDAKELGMIITANGHDCTQDFYKIKDYNETFDNNSISVKRLDKENRTNLIVCFPSRDVTTSNTIFTYPLGETALDYQFSEFQPLFKEDIDSVTLKEAQSKCGDNDACIYDYVLTGNEQLALNTKMRPHCNRQVN
ncbi:fibrillin-3, partial [Biomphalaria pfeifferi]